MGNQLLGLLIYNFRIYLRDRLFHGIILFSCLLLVFSYALSNLTILDNRKIILDFSFSMISIVTIALAIFVGIQSIRREIDTRQSYLVLSKPLSRRLYVFSKALSGAAIIAIAILILFIVLMLVAWHAQIEVPSGTTATIFLIYLESLIVLTFAQSVALFLSSASLSAIISILFFILARSSENFLALSEKNAGSVSASIFRYLYYLIPDLSRYNIRDIVAYAKPYDPTIIVNCSLYTLLFSFGVIVLSAAFFEKQNIK